jgi:TolA-binding protein
MRPNRTVGSRISGWAAAGPRLALLCAVAFCAAPVAGHAQVDSREGLALRNQIDQLRHDLQVLQDQQAQQPGRGGTSYIGRGGPSYQPPQQQPSTGGSDIVTQLLGRVDALEEQVRQLRGRTEENQHQIQQLGADLGKRIDDLAFQMSQGAPGQGSPSGAPGPGPAGSGPAGAGPAGPQGQAARPPPRTPERAMQDASAALARRDYAAAEQAAKEVLAKPSPRSYDAQLLLAQAYYGAHRYPEAALAYDDAYKANRKGNHAQDALLGLANSFIALKQRDAACQTLGKLKAEFPQPRADLRDSIAGARQKGACG